MFEGIARYVCLRHLRFPGTETFRGPRPPRAEAALLLPLRTSLLVRVGDQIPPCPGSWSGGARRRGPVRIPPPAHHHPAAGDLPEGSEASSRALSGPSRRESLDRTVLGPAG